MLRKSVLSGVIAVFAILLLASPVAAQYETDVRAETVTAPATASVAVAGATATADQPAGIGVRSEALPRTGSSDLTSVIAIVGAGLVVTGGLIVLGSRRHAAS